MKFGSVPLDQAVGAILAHSVSVGGKRLRKGAQLTDAEITALRAEGHDQIIVARLDAGDVAENEAAGQLASGISDPAGDGLALTEAFTGRVNIRAESAGVVRVDVARIAKFNSVNPMITIATVPDFHMADKGTMLATIKVISFAVPESDVAAARVFLDGAIRIERPVLKTAALIVTEIDQVASEKGVEAVRTRLDRWGIDLDHVAFCPHEQGAIETKLRDVTADLVMILTASATSDVSDVAPAAVVGVGGRIERFGMPVDPGNLLFVADLQGVPVVGLPGCARSPALNGTDWVLSRIACGIEVRAEDIAGMGVGGLLKEIPTRPQPRSRRGQ